MRNLIAVVSCKKHVAYRVAIRETWLPHVPKDTADVVFFMGSGAVAENPDEVVLECGDDYQSLPSKVREIIRWAYSHGYSYVLKCDNDVILRPDRMLASDFYCHDFVGRGNDVRAFPVPMGFCYWLSRRCMEILKDAELPSNNNDEVWVTSNLSKALIILHNDDRYCLHKGNRNDFIDPEKRPLRVPPRVVTQRNPLPPEGVFAWCLYIMWLGYRDLPEEKNIEEFHRVWKKVRP